MSSVTLELSACDTLAGIAPEAWDALNPTGNPFMRYDFLRALELGDCLEPYGWFPQYLCLRDAEQRLLGAAPCYLKGNSFGEFVFDWSWADAYERHGLRYYPKVVLAAPFTPSVGPRLLVHPEAPAEPLRTQLAAGLRALCQHTDSSGAHGLFAQTEDLDALLDTGFERRTGIQFHWHNRGYRDFEEFLSRLSARKRKKIKRERRQVQEAGIRCEWRNGSQLSEQELQQLHRFYASTYDRKWGAPALSLRFFQEIAARLGEQFLALFAYRQQAPIAVAILYRDDQHLYGRHWGCREQHHSLHFEACYYQGIEYCIEHGLAHFDPGAQGQHKIARGFLPIKTHSAHWLAEPAFAQAVSQFLHAEQEDMAAQYEALMATSPYVGERPA